MNALAFTPDSKYIVTACSEGTWRIFPVGGDSTAIIVVDAHDLGVQGCDFSASSSPFLVPGSSNLILSFPSTFTIFINILFFPIEF